MCKVNRVMTTNLQDRCTDLANSTERRHYGGADQRVERQIAPIQHVRNPDRIEPGFLDVVHGLSHSAVSGLWIVWKELRNGHAHSHATIVSGGAGRLPRSGLSQSVMGGWSQVRQHDLTDAITNPVARECWAEFLLLKGTVGVSRYPLDKTYDKTYESSRAPSRSSNW